MFCFSVFPYLTHSQCCLYVNVLLYCLMKYAPHANYSFNFPAPSTYWGPLQAWGTSRKNDWSARLHRRTWLSILRLWKVWQRSQSVNTHKIKPCYRSLVRLMMEEFHLLFWRHRGLLLLKALRCEWKKQDVECNKLALATHRGQRSPPPCCGAASHNSPPDPRICRLWWSPAL